jgi:type VI secretion system protein ImpA
MPSPDVLEFAKLLAPISGEKPTGVNLRADPSPTSLYYKVKDARNLASATERTIAMAPPKSEGDPEIKPPDWRPVLQHGTRALAESSKDLEITAYLIESLARLHGFAGLRDGFRLARELIEKFWDQLYPFPDEDGLATRVAALTGLNGLDAQGTLIVPILKVPVARSSTLGPLGCLHYSDAAELDKIADAKVREKKVANGALTLDAFRQAVAESPPDFLTNLADDLPRCAEEFDRLCAALDAKCGTNAPPSSNIKSTLASCADVVAKEVKSRLKPAAPPPPPEPDGKAAAAPASAQADGAGKGRGPIASREDALSRLVEVADYFRRTEPHTVVSYALDQVVRWGRMPLPELLAELIPDEGPRKSLFKHVGIRLPEAASKEGEKPKK